MNEGAYISLEIMVTEAELNFLKDMHEECVKELGKKISLSMFIKTHAFEDLHKIALCMKFVKDVNDGRYKRTNSDPMVWSS